MGRATTVPHFTVAERIDRGRSARTNVSRASHASLEVHDDRDPVAWLEAQAPTRVAELLPIRYGRMVSSPLAFFRGAATVMANDLARTPRTDLQVQLSGDAHLMNFGGYASPERDLVFDLNDFDETLPGPFEWDVKRLAASVEIAARDRRLSDAERNIAVLGAIRGYRETMRELAALRNLDVWYAQVDVDDLVAELRNDQEHRDAKTMERAAAHARSNDDARALAKLTLLVDGTPRIVSEPPLIVPIGELDNQTRDRETELREIFRRYRRSLQPDRRTLLEGFSFGDLARKVVGVGSVGTRCWILLLLGRDEEDLLFLQIKEAEASVLEPHLARSAFASHAERIVEGQRLSQATSDIFLGWTHADDVDGEPRDFYVRQLRDWKMSVDVDRIPARRLATYARWCGSTLARAHARSGDSVAIAAYLGKSDEFDRALADFAVASADLNEQDHAALARAVQEGRVSAAEGV